MFAGMAALTIHEAAQTTGWSARMLRFIEQLGLIESPRSPSGYRLYGPAQLQRLRTLRELLDTHGLDLGDIAVALRLRNEPELSTALDAWFEATPRKPADVPDADWLAFEQDKPQSPLNTSTARLPTELSPPPRPSRWPTSVSPSSVARRSASPSTRCRA